MKQVLLLGGGYCLGNLAEVLPAESFVVTSRTKENCDAFRAKGFTSRVVDLANTNSVEVLFEEFGYFSTIIDSVPPFLVDEHYSSYLELLYKFIGVAKERGTKKLVYLSTVGVFGVTDGRVVDEATECAPMHERGQARVDAEQAYLTSGVPSYVLRLSGIYGPGRGLAKRIQSGMYPANFNADKWSNRIHVVDIVSVLRNLCSSESSATEGVYCVTDDCPARLGEVIDYYCQRFNIELKTKEEIPGSTTRRARFALNQRVSNEKMKRELLQSLCYPSFREGATTTGVS